MTETGSGLKFKLKAGEAIHIDFDADSSFRCEVTEDDSSPLICTSGQPSVAALRPLDLLTGEGTQLFYSGDFDGKGLFIAAQLCARYPSLLTPYQFCFKAPKCALLVISMCQQAGLSLTGSCYTAFWKTCFPMPCVLRNIKLILPFTWNTERSRPP